MKDRIKIDSAVLSLIIISTGFLYNFPDLYPQSPVCDDLFDFLGLWVVLTGTFVRMAARSHKKFNSAQGHGLVVSGPYTLTRNPMYLGSFLMGVGFILMTWPWWSLPLFAFLFYQRFNIQMTKEEKLLERTFKTNYTDYKAKVPRIFPRFEDIKKVNLKKDFPKEEIFSTKETRGLATWPLLAIFMELFQEHMIFGHLNVLKTISIFVLSGASFALFLWKQYSA